MEFNAVQLIRVVRDLPQLYDASRPEFKIPVKKDLAWQKIAQKLKVEEEECRKRWRTLRERYTRELKRLKSYKTSAGNASDSDVKPNMTVNWCFFDEMSFLHNHVRLRKHRYKFEPSVMPLKDETDEVDDPDQEDDNSMSFESSANHQHSSHQHSQDSKADKLQIDSDDGGGGSTTEVVAGATLQIEVGAQPQRQQQAAQQSQTAQPVYAKFKVHAIDGHLVNEEFKEYTQLQTLDTVKDGDVMRQAVVSGGAVTSTPSANSSSATSAAAAAATSAVQHHHAGGQEYIIINSNECTTMSGVEEHDVIMEQIEDEQVAEEDDEDGESGGEVDHQEVEFITPHHHHHHQQEQQPQEHHLLHHQQQQQLNSKTGGSSSQRLILTAPRDENSPSPSPDEQYAHMHHTTSKVVGLQVRSAGPVSALTTTKTKQMTVSGLYHHQADHQQHRNNHNNSSAVVCHSDATAVAETSVSVSSDEHDMFGQAVAASLRQLNRLHTIKAKVEIYRVLEKFVEMEECK